MRVATLTTFFANNYGALLQCHALLHVLNNELGVNAETIAYSPPQATAGWNLLYPWNSKRNILRNAILMANSKLLKAKKGRVKANREFIKYHIRKSPTVQSRAELSTLAETYDAVICGSDQIWNQTLFPSTLYFLDFIDSSKSDVKKISYAASVCEPIKDEYTHDVEKCLESFDAISVREAADIELLCPMTEKDIAAVPDPVFLADPEYWRAFAGKVPQKSSPYIFCYFIGGERAVSAIVNAVREATGYRVINMATGYKNFFKGTEVADAVGPREFIRLIRDAEVVLTNSFHCTAFSTIFNKNFYVCALNESRRTRIDNVISAYSDQERYLTSDDAESIRTGKRALHCPHMNRSKLAQDRKAGLDYLRKALNKV